MQMWGIARVMNGMKCHYQNHKRLTNGHVAKTNDIYVASVSPHHGVERPHHQYRHLDECQLLSDISGISAVYAEQC